MWADSVLNSEDLFRKQGLYTNALRRTTVRQCYYILYKILYKQGYRVARVTRHCHGIIRGLGHQTGSLQRDHQLDIHFVRTIAESVEEGKGEEFILSPDNAAQKLGKYLVFHILQESMGYLFAKWYGHWGGVVIWLFRRKSRIFRCKRLWKSKDIKEIYISLENNLEDERAGEFNFCKK